MTMTIQPFARLTVLVFFLIALCAATALKPALAQPLGADIPVAEPPTNDRFVRHDAPATIEPSSAGDQSSTLFDAITPYRPNYFLPLSYSRPNRSGYASDLKYIEAKFQVSAKLTLVRDLLLDRLDVDFGLTMTAWWQLVSPANRSQLRDSSYEPELILRYRRPWSVLGLTVKQSTLAFNHHSNGRSKRYSRSWNRLIAGLEFQHKAIDWALAAWWRIPEGVTRDIAGTDRDDNPGISGNIGVVQLSARWRLPGKHRLDMMIRNNLRSQNRGAVQLDWSFPISQRLRLYTQYFNGYAEGMTDYRKSSQRFGVGLSLANW